MDPLPAELVTLSLDRLKIHNTVVSTQIYYVSMFLVKTASTYCGKITVKNKFISDFGYYKEKLAQDFVAVTDGTRDWSGSSSVLCLAGVFQGCRDRALLSKLGGPSF